MFGLDSGEDAYKAAEDQARKYWRQTQGYGQPVIDQGQAQYAPLMGAEGALLDPAALESKWASGYQTSPYAQQMLKMNQGQGLNAASSMGLMGSSAALGNIQQGAGNIVNQDRQQYLNDLMQKYMSGIGIGQNIYGQGASMRQLLAQLAQQQGNTMAGLKYGQEASSGNMLNGLIGTGLGMAANYFAPGSGGFVSGMFGGGGNSGGGFNQGVPPYMQKSIYGQ